MGTLHQFKKEQEAIQQTGRVLIMNFNMFVVDAYWFRINVDKRLSKSWKEMHKWSEKKQRKHVRAFTSSVVINRMR